MNFSEDLLLQYSAVLGTKALFQKHFGEDAPRHKWENSLEFSTSFQLSAGLPLQLLANYLLAYLR